MLRELASAVLRRAAKAITRPIAPEDDADDQALPRAVVSATAAKMIATPVASETRVEEDAPLPGSVAARLAEARKF